MDVIATQTAKFITRWAIRELNRFDRHTETISPPVDETT
jgi:hypothetical protein